MNELNLCPFCSGEPSLIPEYWRDGELMGGHIICTDCGAKLPRHWAGRRFDVVTIWNERTYPAADERRAIVEWLREESRSFRSCVPPKNREAKAAAYLADAISRGDHRRPE